MAELLSDDAPVVGAAPSPVQTRGVSALAHLRVVELSDEVAAAYCGRQFAAWGADVIALEPDGGGALRRRGPFARTADGEAASMLWAYVSANKRSVWMAADDQGALTDLLGRADVFVTDWSEADLADLGIRLSDLRRRLPGLVVVSVTPFGLDGPYAAFKGADLVVEALSGYLALNGLPDRPPLRAPGHITGFAVGVNAFVGALAALIRRERVGRGDLVEISGVETLASIVPFLRVQYVAGDKVREGGTEAGVRIVPCSNGWVSFLVVDPRYRRLLGEVLAIPEADWPADLYEGGYHQRVAKAVAFFSRYTRRMTAEAVFEALEARGVVCGKVTSPAGLLEDPQLAARGYFRPLDGRRYAGPAARLKNSDIVPIRAAPALADALAPDELGWAPREVSPAPAAAELPLSGYRVLDLTQAWIGPFATLILADLGAEVIKIECHTRPDVWRQASPQPTAITNVVAERVNRSFYFNSVNRNKRDLALDLRTPEGRDLFLRLVKDADVVAENYTPRVMDRFGLGYEALAAVRPDLVMMSSCGFGKTGPLSDYKTNGSAVEGLAGWDWLHRYPGGEPVLMGFYQADAICGLQMAALTLVSLIRRGRTGEGEAIDGAMLEASAGYIGDLILQAGIEGEAQISSNRDPDFAPHGVFPCAGDDRWIAVVVKDDAAWARLAALAHAPPAFAKADWRRREGRLAEEDALEAVLADWTRGQEAGALMEVLQAARVAAGVVRGAIEGLSEPHLAARNWFTPMTHPDLGEHLYNGFPWRFSECALVAHTPPPRLGEHSEVLLKELLGLTETEIEALKAKAVTGAVL
jgi:crotonobetainyl-CoA:carnitine CoA-transferase CaiB-like acyl-CoA transferase